jgi:preprotein translocase subunit YajC
MELQQGDWVETDSGIRGQVIHVSRLTAFVAAELEGGVETLPFLISELRRIDPPHDPAGPTPPGHSG